MNPENGATGPKWALPVLGAAGCLGVLLLAGLGGAVWYWQSRQPAASPGTPSAPDPSASGATPNADPSADLGQATGQPTFEESGIQAIRIGGSVREPKKLHDEPPRYPSAAIERDIQGTVVVDALLEPTGRVGDVRIMRSIPALDDAAVAAVRQWVYEPTVIDGRPTAVILSVPVEFWLRDEEVADEGGDDGGGDDGGRVLIEERHRRGGRVLIEERHRRDRGRVLIEERHRRDRGRRVIVEERRAPRRGRRVVREVHRRN